MTNDEKNLLDNVLDGLDRLFDSESGVIDIQVLIFATSKALYNTEYFTILDDAANNLENVIRSEMKADDKRVEALQVTNNLRHFLAEVLDYTNLKM